MEEDDSNIYPRLSDDWQDADSYNRRIELPLRTREVSQPAIQFQDLYKANQRFRQYIEEIGQLASTPLREDILGYCSGQKKSQKCLESTLKVESLLRKMEVRIEKMIKTKKIKRNWGEQDLRILLWIVSKYCDYKSIGDVEKDMTNEDWKFIASLIPGVTPETCMFKWLSIKKITLATHNWTKNQSQLLSKLAAERLTKYNQPNQVKDWKEISQDLYRLNQDSDKVYRNAKQCREHWTCYLSPQLKKGPWQLYEDVKLLKFIKDNKGLKKWSEIAKNFEGRTQNALKNRYTLIIEKQKRLPKNKHKSQLTLISQYLQKCYVDQYTANVKVQVQQNEPQSIYQSEEQPKDYNENHIKSNLKREEIMNYDTNESVITPVRVQKFSINDFEAMSIGFFRNIQPGVIQSDGTFKKIASTSGISKDSSQSQKSNEIVKIEEKIGNIKAGPFVMFPLIK